MSWQDASFRRRVSGLSVRNSNPPALAGGCLVQRKWWAVIWFGNIEYRKLIKQDEGRNAKIPREMVAGGDWGMPRLNGLKYFEKPPLF